jgi:hypothetical protein
MEMLGSFPSKGGFPKKSDFDISECGSRGSVNRIGAYWAFTEFNINVESHTQNTPIFTPMDLSNMGQN